MTALPALINKTDNIELVRDQIAAILVAESTNQQALATAAAEDPRLWTLRVFTERSNPWNAFKGDEEVVDNPPIVNVWVDSSTYEQQASDIVERQKCVGTFFIDCYGYGRSGDVHAGGHTAGDRVAVFESFRAVRLVRNILMSANNAYLDLRGTVWQRWLQSLQAFQPAIDDLHAQHIHAVRMQFQVAFNEFSPQGEEAYDVLDLVVATVKRSETGEVYLIAEYD